MITLHSQFFAFYELQVQYKHLKHTRPIVNGHILREV
jgi:hypothetical protein